MKTLIFDRGIGFLQHTSDLADEAAALAELHDMVGGINLEATAWQFYRVNDDVAEKVQEWMDNGGRGNAQFDLRFTDGTITVITHHDAD